MHPCAGRYGPGRAAAASAAGGNLRTLRRTRGRHPCGCTGLRRAGDGGRARGAQWEVAGARAGDGARWPSGRSRADAHGRSRWRLDGLAPPSPGGTSRSCWRRRRSPARFAGRRSAGRPPPGAGIVLAPRLSRRGDLVLLGVALTTAPLGVPAPVSGHGVRRDRSPRCSRPSDHATTVAFAAVIFAAYSAVAVQPVPLGGAAGRGHRGGHRHRGVPGHHAAGARPVHRAAGAGADRRRRRSAMRGWRQRAGDSAERLLRAEAEHEAQTRRAVEAERARIAGELHDVVTHNVSVMVVQAGAARSVLDSSPGAGPGGAAGRRGQRADRDERAAAPARLAGPGRDGGRGTVLVPQPGARPRCRPWSSGSGPPG